jgi:hypothetical protein
MDHILSYEQLEPVVFHLPPEARRELTRALRAFGYRRNRPGSRGAALAAIVRRARQHTSDKETA